MPGALRSLSTPPAPNPDAGQQSGALSSFGGQSPGMAPPGAMQGPQAGPPQAPSQIPAPNHAQTVAALRHFHAIGKQLEMALKDPDLGKASVKSKVIDGMTNLVAQRILSPGEAVKQLSTFPERPFEQKAWLANHMMQAQQAEMAVLTHHAMAFGGQGEADSASNPDSHMDDINGMMQSHYGRAA